MSVWNFQPLNQTIGKILALPGVPGADAATATHGAATKSTLVELDEFLVVDSEASWAPKKVSWASLVALVSSAVFNIAKSQLSAAVQASLGKADTAEQSANKGQPNGYAGLDGDGNVPVASLTAGVQTSLGKADTAVQPGDLANKVDKTSASLSVYGTDNAGAQTIWGANTEVAAWSVLLRNAEGATQVGTPTDPAHATPKSYVDGLRSDTARWACNTASGGAGAEDGSNVWAKICTWTPTGEYQDASLILGITNRSSGVADESIVAVHFRNNGYPTDPDVSVQYMAKSMIVGATVLAADAFKVVTGGHGSAMELWVRKASWYTKLSVYELSVSLDGGTTLVYNDGAAWQSAEPTGTVNNVRSNGVTAFGNPVLTAQAYTTGTRPAAATWPLGWPIYDTTLNKPIWSDGTNWRDATGTAV
ncbi:hypothetical protein MycrhDRAFT_6889 [Mycolicibacterium rhodesiae JS60]|nr:hypothetical protein MycrhDRAFT_6889 [Mycolicibacterium rhodesiae JS60]